MTITRYIPSMVSPPLFSDYHGNEQNWCKENAGKRKNSVNKKKQAT
jgi:hypothetical protein